MPFISLFGVAALSIIIKKSWLLLQKCVFLNYFLATLFSDLKYMHIWRDFVGLKSYHLHQFLINKWKFCHSLLDDKCWWQFPQWLNEKMRNIIHEAYNTSSSLRLNDAGMVNGTLCCIKYVINHKRRISDLGMDLQILSNCYIWGLG